MTTTPIFGFTDMEENQNSKYVTFNDALDDIENAIAAGIYKLATKTACLMQNGDAKTIIFTVPASKKCIVMFAVIRNPTASLAGGTDFDMGDGANADTWVNAIDLSSMTAATDYYVVDGSGTKYTIFDAADEIGIKPVTGATADAEATIDLFGYIYDA
jgi:hypothetical protein